eukprot:4880816-Alexandrium_andersonii.AAC.1
MMPLPVEAGCVRAGVGGDTPAAPPLAFSASSCVALAAATWPGVGGTELALAPPPPLTVSCVAFKTWPKRWPRRSLAVCGTLPTSPATLLTTCLRHSSFLRLSSASLSETAFMRSLASPPLAPSSTSGSLPRMLL